VRIGRFEFDRRDGRLRSEHLAGVLSDRPLLAGDLAIWRHLLDKLAQQAQKLKGKWQQRKRQVLGKVNGGQTEGGRGSRREAATPPVPALMEAARQRVQPLTVSEASRQLGAKQRLLVFRNAETMELSVLYRASGGNLVLVETDA
jgi:hypothetical protein